MRMFQGHFALLLLALTGPAAAQTTSEFKAVKVIVSSAAGTSYDSFARVIARHLVKQIPGKPGVIVQNMPGAGGLVAANYLFNIADKDGATLGLLNRNSLIQPIVGNKQARFRSEEFYWLGTPASYRDDPYLFVINANQPYKNAQEVMKAIKPVQVGNSGSVMIDIIKETMGLNVNIVNGYEKNVLDLAFLRGEVDGIGIPYANLIGRFPGMLEKGQVRAIVQYGSVERSPVLPDVPTARELATSPDARVLLGFIEAPLSIAYPFALPPGVPAERAAAMRGAFDRMWEELDYRAEIVGQKLAHAPKGGSEVEREVGELVRAPQSVIKRYNEVAKASE